MPFFSAFECTSPLTICCCVTGMCDSWITILSQNFAGVTSKCIDNGCMRLEGLCASVQVNNAHAVVLLTTNAHIWRIGGCSADCTTPKLQSRQAISSTMYFVFYILLGSFSIWPCALHFSATSVCFLSSFSSATNAVITTITIF